MTETITLSDAQIDAGRIAAMDRTPTWQPTPAEGLELARQLFEKEGRFGPWNEAVRVGRLIGKHGDQVGFDADGLPANRSTIACFMTAM